jgi:hypothetical protein
MNTHNENQVYVLQIRWSGEEDEVFLFRQIRDARAKVYDFFRLATPDCLCQDNLDSIQEAFFDNDAGYFSIYTTTIQ